MADIFDVLADETRRELLVTLHAARVQGSPNGELTVSELVEKLGLSQPTVSKHLQKLREQGLVSVRTHGQHHNYRLQAAPLRELERWVADLLEGDHDADDAEGAAAFAAWSGADLGESLGRRLADGTHQARAVVAEAQVKVGKAQEKVVNSLPKIGKRKTPDGAVDTE
jgi:ArsR family transcriptional regulator, arsenate/arsenite/antimonite-responsive transcriptional repressor